MSVLMWFVLIYLLISLLVPGVLLILSKMMKFLDFSVNVFECGFDSYNVSVLPISMRFFVFCIVFLILDLELIIVSLSPLVVYFMGFIIGVYFFLVLVTLSVIMDWFSGGLSWVE